MGAGWSWSRKPGDEADHAAAAVEDWAEIARLAGQHARVLYVLDEFTYPLKWGWLDTAEVVEVLRNPSGNHKTS